MLKRDEIADPNSCWNKAQDIELLFVLLGRDVAAPDAIRYWAHRRVDIGKNQRDDHQIREALACADRMDQSLRHWVRTRAALNEATPADLEAFETVARMDRLRSADRLASPEGAALLVAAAREDDQRLGAAPWAVQDGRIYTADGIEVAIGLARPSSFSGLSDDQKNALARMRNSHARMADELEAAMREIAALRGLNAAAPVPDASPVKRFFKFDTGDAVYTVVAHDPKQAETILTAAGVFAKMWTEMSPEKAKEVKVHLDAQQIPLADCDIGDWFSTDY